MLKVQLKLVKVLLNLGAGRRILSVPGPDWVVVNHDLFQHSPEINFLCDLDVLPWPWLDCSIDSICSWSVFEHLKITPLEACNECWRILRPGGVLEIKMPLWDSDEGHNDLTHRWWIGHHAWNGLDPETERGRDYAFYGTKPWKIVSQNEVPGGSSLYGKLTPRK